MLQLTPHMRLLVCVEPADFRKGIDGLVRICRDELAEDPFRECVAISTLAASGPAFSAFLAP